MAQRMSHEDSGQDGRSVLGMLAIQVERDPKTGATIVKSVAPISSAPAAPTSTTIFDDGRKSIHTVGRLEGEPSTKELGEILSVINDVGMTVLLDEVTVTPNKPEVTAGNIESRNKQDDNSLSFITPNGTSKENVPQLDNSENKMEAERMTQSFTVRNMDHETKDTEEILENLEGKSLEEGPVTLVFMGYTDGTPEDVQNQEDYEGMLTAEHVIITEDGEEYVVEPGNSAPIQSASTKEREEQTEEKPQDKTLQDVPLDDDDEAQPETQRESSVGNEAKKRKKCKCCSVM
ncbi:paralemmin-2-like isoform X1 [Cyprinodon tularosa]|uniref:paralemmin-2-like isoform X1 n=2 Tax=Cyprinodon tularosa TaxID=77115 RepID=UPI0018E27501|nr:paralemmin-2-like isoform X1 [Cyprinodon tularosa]